MSFLTQKLPSTVIVDGSTFRICSDFKTVLRFFELMESPLLTESEKTLFTLSLFYGEEAPFNSEKAFIAVLDFITGDYDHKTGQNHAPVICYQRDAKIIFSSFLEAYSINLLDVNLHWYAFVALLENLPEDSKLSKVIGYRTANLSKYIEGESRNQMMRLKEHYALSTKTIDQQMTEAFHGLL